MPIVSVIIPVYNSEKYLHKCLDSLLAQTLTDIEIICVNDGSKDCSLEILEQYAEADSRIQVVSQGNQGAGPARNAGIERATGKYLSILDADDFFSPDMLEKAVKKAEEDEAEIVVFKAWNYNDMAQTISNNEAVVKVNLVDVESPFSKKEFSKYLLNFTWGCAWNKLFLRSFVLENNLRFQAVRLADDIYFVLLAMAKADRISFLNENLLYYRMDNPMSQQGQTNKTPTEFFLAYYELKLSLQKEGIYEQVEQSFVNRALSNCISRLGMLSAYQPYEYLYNKLRDEFFGAFEFDKYDKDYFYNQNDYEEYQLIKSCSVGEYLYKHKYTLEHYIYGSYKQLYFKFPFETIKEGSRIVLYGAGDVGNAYYRQILCSHYADVVLWVDKRYEECGPLVNSPQMILETEYDYIFISIVDANIAQIIQKYLIDMGVDETKIIWRNPIMKVV